MVGTIDQYLITQAIKSKDEALLEFLLGALLKKRDSKRSEFEKKVYSSIKRAGIEIPLEKSIEEIERILCLEKVIRILKGVKKKKERKFF